jgi:hypothetical protein
MEKNSNVISYQTTQKDWEDFFADWDLREGTTYPLGTDPEWLCVASQHGRIKIESSSQRLVAEEKKPSRPPDGYEFDR